RVVAERDRGRIAAVLAADPDLEVRIRGAATVDRGTDQLADARDVERCERIRAKDPVLQVVRQETTLRIVAREPERGLRQVVRAEREEVGVLRELAGAQGGAWQLDHRAAAVVEPTLFGDGSHRQLAEADELLRKRNERMHDLDARRD